MIMPCMKSTSACDRGGSFPVVEGGSLLLGFPGAPGWTTTGPPALACCACAGEHKKIAGAPAAITKPRRYSTANALAVQLPLPGQRLGSQFRTLLGILGWEGNKACHETLTFSGILPDSCTSTTFDWADEARFPHGSSAPRWMADVSAPIVDCW